MCKKLFSHSDHDHKRDHKLEFIVSHNLLFYVIEIQSTKLQLRSNMMFECVLTWTPSILGAAPSRRTTCGISSSSFMGHRRCYPPHQEQFFFTHVVVIKRAETDTKRIIADAVNTIDNQHHHRYQPPLLPPSPPPPVPRKTDVVY